MRRLIRQLAAVDLSTIDMSVLKERPFSEGFPRRHAAQRGEE
ncbi:MAG: hypothetical protein QM757_47265 [Paludibaculum sp.]